MRAHYLQHATFEELGIIEPWLEKVGYKITSTRLFESTNFPSQHSIDLLIIMGGPMSVNEENEFPWLAAEKQFIREVINLRKPVLGICLGAQLIANAMGAKVYRNKEKEIGWFPISGVPSDNQSVFKFPPTAQVFHWHSETFDLPRGAIHLAKSDGCENQAFQLGESVIGLQCHPEVTPESVQRFVSCCLSDLESAPSKYTQTAEEIIAANPENYQSVNHLMSQILSFILQKHSAT